jgi:protein O-mannosyl-transferase
MKTDILVIVVLVAATAGVYGQVAGHEFLNFDDYAYAAKNPHVSTGLSSANAAWAFTSTEASNWHPLTWLSLQADASVFGIKIPGGFHVTNLVLHILSTVLLYVALRRMTAAAWPSAAVAALFALHPLHVESVAWVAERKDVLSTVFWMLTLLAYAWYVERPDWKRYLLVAASLGLGLMAKPMLVTLPFVLLLLDWWPLGRLRSPGGAGRLVLEKVPLLALAAISCIITVIAQQHAMTGDQTLDIRLQNAAVSYMAYLGKTLWPTGLIVLYPYPEVIGLWQWLAAFLALAFITATVWRASRRRPYLAVGWFWFLGTLAPVIGLVQVGMQSMADRYTYVPLIGLFIMAAWGLADVAAAWPKVRPVIATLAVTVLVVLAGAAAVQAGFWKNSVTLFRHALEIEDRNALAHNQLGEALALSGDTDGALAEFEKAMAIAPGYAEAYANAAVACLQKRDFSRAAAFAVISIEFNASHPSWFYVYGDILSQQGRRKESAAVLRRSLRLDPNFAEAHALLASQLLERSEHGEALDHWREAERLKPDPAGWPVTMGNRLVQQGRWAEALAVFSIAIEGQSKNPAPYNTVAWILATHSDPSLRNGPKAVALAERAVALAQRNPGALDTLAAAYAEAGEFPKAVAVAEEAEARAASSKEPQLAGEIHRRLVLYRAGQPYHEPVPPPH